MLIQSLLAKVGPVPLGLGRGAGSWSYTAFFSKALLLSRNGKGWCLGLVQIVQEEEDNFLEEGCA